MTLPDGKSWLPPVEPAPKPLSLRGKICLGVFYALLAGFVGEQGWNTFYWGTPPQHVKTTTAIRSGVIRYQAAMHGDWLFQLETASGDQISLSCEPVYRRYVQNDCMTPLIDKGVVGHASDPGPRPVVEVAFLYAEDEPRFNNLVVSVRRDSVELLDPARRLADAGINPSGRVYNALLEHRAGSGR